MTVTKGGTIILITHKWCFLHQHVYKITCRPNLNWFTKQHQNLSNSNLQYLLVRIYLAHLRDVKQDLNRFLIPDFEKAFGIYGNTEYAWVFLITQFMRCSLDCGVRQITVKMSCLNLAINSSTEYHPGEMFLPTCERLCQITMETTETSLCHTFITDYPLAGANLSTLQITTEHTVCVCVCVCVCAKRREIIFLHNVCHILINCGLNRQHNRQKYVQYYAKIL